MKRRDKIKMRKLLKNRKALSPVVAAIILIAVTVAVSIAVAAWMGALTFTFMSTEELKIVGAEFTDGTLEELTITIRNSGTAKAVIVNIKVESEMIDLTDGTPSGSWDGTANELTLEPGEGGTVTGSFDWSAGTAYNVAVVTKAGNVFTYRAVAPT